MYILKNAWTSIKRNKGRNILIGIIIMVIGCACAVTLAIRNSANKLIESYQDQYEVTATIGMNRDKLMQNMKPGDSSSKEDMQSNFNNIESLTIDDVKNYADSSYVKSYYYTTSIGVNASNLEAATSNDNNAKGPGGNNTKQVSTTSFTLEGYSSIEAMEEFIEGSYTITDGEISSDFTSNNCIINSELATLNNLSVGDTITITDPNNSKLTYTFTITGIFEESSNSSDKGMSMFSNSANTIITNTTAVENIYNKDNDLKMTVNPTFVLNDKSDIEAFQNELTDKGLSEYLSLSTNLDQVNSATSSISNVKTFATTFLIITLVIGGVVLFVINLINVRERKYEIGVLRTIGMKKSTLTGQFIIELLIVSFVSLLIGAGIGSMVSVPVSNKLLENEINSSTEQATKINNNFGGTMNEAPSNNSNSTDNTNKNNAPDRNQMQNINGLKTVQAYDSINAVVDYKVLLELMGIGLLLTLFSSVASMISINRFTPLTILKERS
jgi:putative ABC transport system permease protein